MQRCVLSLIVACNVQSLSIVSAKVYKESRSFSSFHFSLLLAVIYYKNCYLLSFFLSPLNELIFLASLPLCSLFWGESLVWIVLMLVFPYLFGVCVSARWLSICRPWFNGKFLLYFISHDFIRILRHLYGNASNYSAAFYIIVSMVFLPTLFTCI